MLGSMKRAELNKLLDKLKTETDPKFQKEMSAISDGLRGMLDGPRKGGKSRAKRLSKKRRSEIASNAAKARWVKATEKRA